MMGGFDGLIGAASGIAIGSYLFAVVYRGNTAKLGEMLYHEEGYLEFIVALMILGALKKYGTVGKVSAAITAAAFITMMIKFGNNTEVNKNLALFASGQKSALDTLRDIVKGM